MVIAIQSLSPIEAVSSSPTKSFNLGRPPKAESASPSQSDRDHCPIGDGQSPSPSSIRARSSPVAEDLWKCRDGENVVLEIRTKWCFPSSSLDNKPSSIRQCDLRISELHQKHIMPSRRISLRTCVPQEQVVSYCKVS